MGERSSHALCYPRPERGVFTARAVLHIDVPGGDQLGGLVVGPDTEAASATWSVVARRALFARLTEAGRVTVLSAPAGSGKTILLRSWIADAGLAERAAWVSVHGEERHPQRFWISVADALRQTAAGSALIRPLTAAPDLDGWAIVERLLEDLHSVPGRIWLVIDDLHELRSAQAFHQLELLVMRAPAELRFVLASRRDLQLGLHRLRLDGELTEIRAAELRFTVDESRDLLEAAGVRLAESALALLHERTEGWAAGMRLAALSLAGHPDPELFATGFSGSERTVAEYLLAEVLERQPKQVRRLLVQTSMLERVTGELADVLTGGSGGGRILRELEQANAFVVALDAHRSWFRYHPLFADLLQLELLDAGHDELARLHDAAAGWFAEHGFPVDAVRHAQAAQDWSLAGRLLSDHWFGFVLDGRAATADELLAGFPAAVIAADAELTALLAARELDEGSFEEAERNLQCASAGVASVPAERRGHLQVTLAVLRLNLALLRGDVAVLVEEARHLLEPTGTLAAAQMGLGEELRAIGLLGLGTTEFWTARFEEAERHLEQARALAHRIGRPYLEFSSLVFRAIVETLQSSALVVEPARRRSNWPGSTAGPTTGSLVPPTWRWVPRWSGRDGLRRHSRGSSALSAWWERKPGPRPGWRCTTCGRSSNSPAAVTRTRWPPSGRESGWRSGWSGRTRSLRGCAPCCCEPWSGRVRPTTSSRPSLNSTRKSVKPGKCAPPWRRCGSPRTTRRRRPSPSSPSWTAPYP
jgi:LuxR family transcriptional regulator, maltose regulon positive regulatory protein